MSSATRDPLVGIAKAIRPLLNRVVFTGIHPGRFLHRAERDRIRRPTTLSSTVTAIATVALDRLAPELVAAGLERGRRERECDVWLVPGNGQLRLTSATGSGTGVDALTLEYAVLLTRSVVLDGELTVRVTVPAIQFLLSWAEHRASGAAFTESADVEDMLEIAVAHTGLFADVEALPDDLRTVVAEAAGTLAAHESCRWVLGRALPDARLAPGVITHAIDRLRRISSLGTPAAA